MKQTKTDLGFLNQLEATTLPPAAFDHEGHMRAAWLYFRQDDPETAQTRFIAALKRYAASLGQARKYHATITLALLQIVRCRMADGGPDETWGEFARHNEDLFSNAMGVIEQHYSPECLATEEAREQFLSPDREPLPEVPVIA
jgi:hypothetical protein